MTHLFDVLSVPGLHGKLLFTPCPGTKAIRQAAWRRSLPVTSLMLTG